ncbi:sodium/potassium-transporting ATPase subunit beta-1-interacting protein [Daktulosphaira vitifoliae]|uniref:sodium/potassium-transporting ATPase subunit beta-1-interacting protein n=1 Tax=Daktulosphaira vitifoliae TaxID=58002 RepID=UPI0021AAD93E|nr:sodium/potassium-transporting ATPase subunit beta-1-interacting protein [Daktulosphaira vitifoliae]
MEFCKYLLLTIFMFQMVSVGARQVFDFLGFMWGSVLANFFELLFIIFGIFGVIQSDVLYLLSYSVWSIVWSIWNIFVVLYYLDIKLNSYDIMSLGAESVSWWESNGPGCKIFFYPNHTGIEEDAIKTVRPDLITGCVVDYQKIEMIQATLQILFAICGILCSLYVSCCSKSRDDGIYYKSKAQSTITPIYSIEYSSRRGEDIDVISTNTESDDDDLDTQNSHNKPMTPRRVKRRSVTSRGTLPPPHQAPPPYLRRQSSSQYSSRRHKNPVSRLIQQQYSNSGLNDSSTSNDSNHPLFPECRVELRNVNRGFINPALDTESERPTSARSTYSNFHGARGKPRLIPPTHSTFFAPSEQPPPAYRSNISVNSETVI